MLRSGFILGLSAPAAILTLLVHPMVRTSADQWTGTSSLSVSSASELVPSLKGPATLVLPGTRPVSLAINPTRVASLQSELRRVSPSAVETAQEMGKDLGNKAPLKPRRMMREGCEAAVSALAGPEARRMTPGRCIS